MDIQELGDNQRDQWDRFVSQQADATCFHWYGWRYPLRDVLGYETRYLGAFEDGVLVGIFPIALVSSRLFGRSLVGLPFCSYGGPVAVRADIEAALLARGVELAVSGDVKYLEVRRLSARAGEAPTQDLYVTFRKALPATLDEGMSFLPSKRRNMVRKAFKQGLRHEVSRDVDSFFRLYLCNARAHGTPSLPKEFFVRLLDCLGDRADILFVKDAQGKPISCIMSFYIHGEIHAGFAGEDPDARATSANDLKYWGLMEHAVARGCRLFDFGRSKVGTGSYAFKKLWGFEPVPLGYEYPYLPSGQIPQNNPSNAKYALAISVWKRLPFWLIERLGPRIIHGLG